MAVPCDGQNAVFQIGNDDGTFTTIAHVVSWKAKYRPPRWHHARRRWLRLREACSLRFWRRGELSITMQFQG